MDNPLKGIPKPALYISAAAAMGILGYAYYKRRQGGTTAAASSTTSTVDPNIDPATGIPYADEFGAGVGSGYAGMGIFDPGTGQIFGTGYGGNQIVQTVSTNAAWAQAAEAYLTTIGQYDANTVAAALGKVLSGQPVTTDQLAIYNAATAFEGYPPQPIPPIVMVPPAGQGGTGGTVIGGGPVTGLHLKTAYRNSATIAWNGVTGAKGYTAKVGSHSQTTTNTTTNVGGLKANTAYTITVTPIRSDGTPGSSTSVNLHTKK